MDGTREDRHWWVELVSGWQVSLLTRTRAAVSRLRLADCKLERVASLKDFRRVIFALYPWSELTPDGSPLLMPKKSTPWILRL